MADLKETEWDLLEALWTLNRATATEVTAHLQERRGWAYSTVKTLLDRMGKGAGVGARQVGNVWEYRPAIARETARRGAWTRLVDLAFGGSVDEALHFVVEQRTLTPEQRRELLALLEDGGEE